MKYILKYDYLAGISDLQQSLQKSNAGCEHTNVLAFAEEQEIQVLQPVIRTTIAGCEQCEC